MQRHDESLALAAVLDRIEQEVAPVGRFSRHIHLRVEGALACEYHREVDVRCPPWIGDGPDRPEVVGPLRVGHGVTEALEKGVHGSG